VPEAGGEPRLRPFWSGTITFGLVSVSVNLYPATTSRRPRLRMVSKDGTPLKQRYYCPEHERAVSRDEIVRGFETDDGQVVVLQDEELEALAPERTREIDLRRFVERDELDPLFFERSYLLTPQEGHAKAYRLLVEAMARTGRAGVATFVMREKEYLVAILSRDGLLHAETMRFPHEVRMPEDVGIEPPSGGDTALAKKLRAAIRADAADDFDEGDLEDPFRESLLALVQRKLARGRDVVSAPSDADAEHGASETQIIDLMEALRRSLAADDGEDGGGSATRKELYERARELDIPGRSSMSKQQLVEAIRSA
jgi:DNA end-binding protein Ku